MHTAHIHHTHCAYTCIVTIAALNWHAKSQIKGLISQGNGATYILYYTSGESRDDLQGLLTTGGDQSVRAVMKWKNCLPQNRLKLQSSNHCTSLHVINCKRKIAMD